MYVSTDRRGYCPGESVAMDAFFSNQSTRRVRPEAALHQTQVQTVYYDNTKGSMSELFFF